MTRVDALPATSQRPAPSRVAVPRPDRLKVTEIFRSIQGEADAVGWPTTFVRLTGCPLRCTWCDTEYAFTGGAWMTLDAIVAEVGRLATRHVCVTGGEPLAQKRCVDLLKRLCDARYAVSLETSGALDVGGVDPRVRKVVDLKAPGSGEASRNLWSNLDHLSPPDQVKIVIADRADYEWAVATVRAHELPRRCQVLFAPVHDVQDPRELAEWILADGLEVRLQIQLHKLLWGNAPGR